MTDDPFRVQRVEGLDAAAFWDVYYSGRLRALTRSAWGAYAGTYDRYAEGHILPEEQTFVVSHDELEAYDYRRDVRFRTGVYRRFGEGLAAILSSPALRVDTLPNRGQLRLAAELLEMAVPPSLSYEQERILLSLEARRREVDLEAALAVLERGLPSKVEYEQYEQTGDTAHLGTDRQLVLKALGLTLAEPKGANALFEAFLNQYEDSDTTQVAIWALGRRNDPESIAILLESLGSDRHERFSMSIQRALQFLCSGPELVPLAFEDEVGHWERAVAALPEGEAARAAHDASSVFWEKRLRCGVAWGDGGPISLGALAGDEVGPVREALRRGLQ